MNVAHFLPLFLCFAIVGAYYTVEFHRGMESEDREVRERLRKLWCGVPEKGFATYAYHLAPEPNRSRLRRSAWASLLGLSIWAIAATMFGAWWIAPLPVALGLYHYMLLAHRPETHGDDLR